MDAWWRWDKVDTGNTGDIARRLPDREIHEVASIVHEYVDSLLTLLVLSTLILSWMKLHSPILFLFYKSIKY